MVTSEWVKISADQDFTLIVLEAQCGLDLRRRVRLGGDQYPTKQSREELDLWQIIPTNSLESHRLKTSYDLP